MSLNINSFNSNTIGTLFSSLTYTKSSTYTGIEGILSDYSSLQSGSYNKLLKAYYSKVDTSSTEKNSTKKNEATSEYSSVQKDANNLSEACNKLLAKGTSSIWNKVESKDENGKITSDYDKDKIASAISSFVSEYNDMVDSGQKSSNTGILTQVAGMVSIASKNLSSFSQVGISIGSDNHLTFDGDYFKKNADISVAKSLFNGNGSFAYNVSTKASMVKSYASTKLSDLSGSKLYSNTGNYSLSSSDILSSLNNTI